MSAFTRAFSLVVGEEGGFSNTLTDPRNWTSGRIGEGILRGTKFGIRASAYPHVEIAALTLDQAQAIYKRDYWDKLGGDSLPPPLALLLFDAAVHCGMFRAARWLQQAAGVPIDGRVGPATIQTIARAAQQPGGGAALCAEFLAIRLAFMASLPTWPSFGLGWARRLCRLAYDSLTIIA